MMITTKKPTFKKTIAQTLKANTNTVKAIAEKKTILDYSLLLEMIDKIDFSVYNDLTISNKAIAELLAEKIANSNNFSMQIIKITTYHYTFYIHTYPRHYSVYDEDDYKKLYNYYYYDNMEIVMYSNNHESAIFSEKFNSMFYQPFRAIEHTNINE